MLRGSTVALVVVGLGFAISGYACVQSTFTTNKQETTAGTRNPSGSGASTGSSSSGFDRNALLTGLADNVIVPTYADFVTSARALESATATYATTLSSVDHESAQQAWRDAMDVWQRAECFQIGPAGVSDQVAGGQDLRDEIYSWTLVNRCATDQVIVSRAFVDAQTFAQQLVNVRGLDAIEYLLFNESPSNTCAPQVPINADGSWDALTDLDQRRADYASALARLVRERAETLHQAWARDGGNFASVLGDAGRSTDTYASAHAAANAVSDAMFYLEAKTKDVKLAIPTGLSPDCGSDTCADRLELAFSKHSKEAVRQNIRAFELMFVGGEDANAIGFDDWLRDIGAAEVSELVLTRLSNATAAVDAIEEGDLATALANDPASVEAVYFALKDVSDLLKSDFITTLDLELPMTVQGDND